MKSGSAFGMRMRSVLTFNLFFGYALAVLFEGAVFYSLAERYGEEPTAYVMTAILGMFLGFLCGWLFAKNVWEAKRVMLAGMAVCLCFTGVFFFPPSGLWLVAMAVCAFSAGVANASWGHFLMAFTPKGERIKSCADVLICSNLLMICVNLLAAHLSPFVGLGAALLLIVAAMVCAAALPVEPPPANAPKTRAKIRRGLVAPVAALAVFVTILTINSGLMYQVIVPAYDHLTALTSWYWALPYIAVIYLMRNLSGGRAWFLHLGMCMMVAAFLLFLALDRGVGSYIAVDTLMLGAYGIFDLFWWSTLGEMIDLSENPSRVFGIGMAANVFGILLGNSLALTMGALRLPSTVVTIVALTVACATLMMLPPLNNRLSAVLKNHGYLTVFSVMPEQERVELASGNPAESPLTPRENEILPQVLSGKTNRAIAEQLGVTENTVKSHLRSIYVKYGVSTRLELVAALIKENKE